MTAQCELCLTALTTSFHTLPAILSVAETNRPQTKFVCVVQKQQDVMQLQDRIDHLDSQQRQQLEELRHSNPMYLVDRMGGGREHISSDSPARSVASDQSDM